VFPTCLVEYQKTDIGQDLVKVYERNGIECSLADGASCCGAPFLHSGDLDQFTKIAEKNVKALAASVRQGKDIVVPQPTCGYVLKKDYVDYVGGADAQLVSEHTFDAAEYLMKVHKAEGTTLDTEFTGDVPETVTYHVPCHLKAQNIGLKSRDRRQGEVGSAVQRYRRHVGPAGRERTSVDAHRREVGRRDPPGQRRRRRRRLSPGQHRHRRADG
jgi:Fe-S oxidoreductase